ncbi:MAG: 2-oxoglutarate ferredoxin oxidoreductase subunit beta, partial [Dethiobacter sp.]|nr:2-oxoglutarate ferredoxin oxidoreductase subunit beta [Dethiobacter sp.]
MAAVEDLSFSFLRTKRLPHIWCPGCGNGIVTAALVRAIGRCGYDQREVVIVSGIGCSSRAAGYLNFNTLHATHGRALSFATGLKMARPELKIFVIMGDGDCSAIGGNHFIHTARRNIDLNAVIINNFIYGMTGGQHSPLTPVGKKATTAPQGTLERPFRLLDLARGAGATFGARGSAAEPR